MIYSYTLVILGSNTALSISDLLVLLWNDVYDLESRILRVHVTVNEKKVKKKWKNRSKRRTPAVRQAFSRAGFSPFFLSGYFDKPLVNPSAHHRNLNPRKASAILLHTIVRFVKGFPSSGRGIPDFFPHAPASVFSRK